MLDQKNGPMCKKEQTGEAWTTSLRSPANKPIGKWKARSEYVAKKLSGLSETLGKETSRGDGTLPVWQIHLEGIVVPVRASRNSGWGALSSMS
jgi:hypothetical protein